MDHETCISAAMKHVDDVERLFQCGGFDNTAYLAGYVAECSLKSLLLRPGLPAGKQLGHDLTLMVGSALYLAVTICPARRRSDLPTSKDFLDLTLQWNPDERYKKRGTTSVTTAESRQRATQEIEHLLLIPQILDGHQFK